MKRDADAWCDLINIAIGTVLPNPLLKIGTGIVAPDWEDEDELPPLDRIEAYIYQITFPGQTHLQGPIHAPGLHRMADLTDAMVLDLLESMLRQDWEIMFDEQSS